MLELKTYRNFNEVCETLGWEKGKVGNSRKAQLKKFEELCTYERKGNSYTIISLNSSLSSRYKYSKTQKSDLEVLLINLLLKNNGNIISTKKYLFELLGMVNNKYVDSYTYNRDCSYLSNKLEVERDIVIYCYEMVTRKCSELLQRTLDSLENNNIITYDRVMCVKRDEYEEGIDRFATEEEILIIRNIEEEIIKEMNIKNSSALLFNNRLKQTFKHLVYNKLHVCSDVDYYYYSYNIRLIPQQYTMTISSLEEKEESRIKYILKEKIKTALINSIKKGYYKTMDKFSNTIGIKKVVVEARGTREDKIRIIDDYINKAISIIKELI